MTNFPDPYDSGRARGWRIHDANATSSPTNHTCDVVVIGSGAGGGISAEMLSAAGLNVAIVEAGPLRSSKHFKMREWQAYRELYQDNAGRQVADGSIGILQGRCVGGSTTVNWTSSFRTPDFVLEYWQQALGLTELSSEGLARWFDQVHERLGIAPWTLEPNLNNGLLGKGGEARGVKFKAIPRNTKDCLDLGYCGMGCPTNAKQSMLVTSIPAALETGATLFENLLAERVLLDGNQAKAVRCRSANGRSVQIEARHIVLAGGAIGTPGILLRSNAPDPYKTLGARTFLHPTVVSTATYAERINAFSGAPQSLYSDHFIRRPQDGGAVSFKIEAAPLHPALAASVLWGNEHQHLDRMKAFPHTQVSIGLLRDGFHADAAGGTVRINSDGEPILHYSGSAYLYEGARSALLALADIQFAAGAKRVFPGHGSALDGYASWQHAKENLEQLPFGPRQVQLVSAHVMGGCGMADTPERGVIDHLGRHFQLVNVSVHDGSMLPTSLGVNPQVTIYSLAARAASALVAKLTGRAAPGLLAR